MNTIKPRTVVVAVALASLTACEGEPPKVPTNPASQPTTQAVEPAAVEPANAAAAPPAPTGSAETAATGPCNCPCAEGAMHGGMHGTMMAGQPAPQGSAAPSASAESAASAAAPIVSAAPDGAGVAQAPGAHANVVGTVTTMPERSAGAAVVYLEDAPVLPNRGSLAGVDNRGMSFAPFVTVVVAGGRVVFSNSDPFPHNVFSPDGDRFNLGMVQPKASVAHVFKTPGVYSLLCNLHPNMLGYVVVSPSSYFARTNPKGQFTIKDVPAGTYKITAWAPRQQPLTESVTVKDADITADFVLHR